MPTEIADTAKLNTIVFDKNKTNTAIAIATTDEIILTAKF
jgi:hypothetical protein